MSENGDRRREVAELGQQHTENQRQREQQHTQQIVKGLLLLLIRAAVFDTYVGWQMQVGHSLLNLRHSGAKIGAFEAPGNDDLLLQVLAANFVLRRQLLDVCQ